MCLKAPFRNKGGRRSLEQTRGEYGEMRGQKKVRAQGKGLTEEKRRCQSQHLGLDVLLMPSMRQWQ